MSKREHKSAILEFERLDRKDEAEVVTEEARAAYWDSEYWTRLQDEARGYGVGEWA